jgi:DNA uptake protein ComE-like DNA-binding protein
MTLAAQRLFTAFTVLAMMLAFEGHTRAQAGVGLIDPNIAGEKELLALPHMTPTIVQGLMTKRPFLTVVDLHAFLLSQTLTPQQTSDVYRHAFVHVNLNTASREEFGLIPGAAGRMAREFAEYRPWKNFAQFDKEIGKYVGQQETDRLKKYVFIPVNLNTASDHDILSIPGTGQRMVKEFKEYRPWRSREQFDKEIGKYVGPKEVARLWRYVVIH